MPLMHCVRSAYSLYAFSVVSSISQHDFWSCHTAPPSAACCPPYAKSVLHACPVLRLLQAVSSGQIKIVPERFEKIYNRWLENIKDWCISRQLWWGHRIPVYYVFQNQVMVLLQANGQNMSLVCLLYKCMLHPSCCAGSSVAS